MPTSITQFFANLKLPLHNTRWSWGAAHDVTVLLRTWADEYSGENRSVSVLRYIEDMNSNSVGLDERINQLEQLWAGGSAGYVVIATARDAKASPREIKEFRDDAVFPIDRLELAEDGSINARLGAPVAVHQLATNARSHKTAAGSGEFPIPKEWRTGLLTAGISEKVPLIRAWLIEDAKKRSKVTYGDVMQRYGLHYYALLNIMGQIGRQSIAQGEPVLTALIVSKDTGRCSQGILKGLGITDDEHERQRLYDFWAGQGEQGATGTGATKEDAPAGEPTEADLKGREERFVQVQVRTEQAEFRRAVFRRFGGQCVVTGCSVPEALEAAHIKGRLWREGHNRAEDGLLLRRDIHALYDRDLLTISESFNVTVGGKAASEYAEFSGPAKWRPLGDAVLDAASASR